MKSLPLVSASSHLNPDEIVEKPTDYFIVKNLVKKVEDIEKALDNLNRSDKSNKKEIQKIAQSRADGGNNESVAKVEASIDTLRDKLDKFDIPSVKARVQSLETSLVALIDYQRKVQQEASSGSKQSSHNNRNDSLHRRSHSPTHSVSSGESHVDDELTLPYDTSTVSDTWTTSHDILPKSSVEQPSTTSTPSNTEGSYAPPLTGSAKGRWSRALNSAAKTSDEGKPPLVAKSKSVLTVKQELAGLPSTPKDRATSDTSVKSVNNPNDSSHSATGQLFFSPSFCKNSIHVVSHIVLYHLSRSI